MQIKDLQLTRAMRNVLLILLLCMAGMTKTYAYDFSAVCETGQTLYYNITDATNHHVELTCPGEANYSNCWAGFDKPTGDIIFQESVQHEGVSYTVTSIGNYAFCNCSGLTGSLTIPNSVTTIGNSAFINCDGFTGELTLPNSVTIISYCAFAQCSGFTGELTLPSSVTTIDYGAFNLCYGFTGELTIPNFVTTIGEMAFATCRGFTGLTIGNSVTEIRNQAFTNCNGFTGDLIIPNSVTTIGEKAFSSCGFTGSLIIGDSVTTIGYRAFWGSGGFTGSLILGSSVTTIGERAFNNCTRIISLCSHAETPPYLGTNAFPYTYILDIPVTVPCGAMSAYQNASGWSQFTNYLEDCSVGLLNGVFSVSEHNQVCFSQGNLQYRASTNTWRFAENQWDFVGSTVVREGSPGGTVGNSSNHLISPTYDGWIDMFGWGTSGYDHGAVCYQPWSISETNSDYYAYGFQNYNLYDQNGQADWGYNNISNGGNQENSGWHTLSKTEWNYLFNVRQTASGIRWAKARVNGVGGIILVPDNWNSSIYTLNNTNPSNNSCSYEDNVINTTVWNNTLEPNGVIFLPAVGYRWGTLLGLVGFHGNYWSSSVSDINTEKVSNIFFDSSILAIDGHANQSNRRHDGFAVRLVKTIQASSYNINVISNPSDGGIVLGAGTYELGDTCTLIATPNEGFVFLNWTQNDNVVSTSPTYSFTVIGNATYVANFTNSALNGYISDGLIMYLDGINNTRNGHSTTTNVWEDLMGNYDLAVSNYSSYTWEDNHFFGVGNYGYLYTGYTWQYFNSLNDDITIEIVTYIDCDKTSPSWRGLAGWHSGNDGTNFQNDQGGSRMQTLGQLPVSEADNSISTVSYTRFNGSFLNGIWKTNNNNIPSGISSNQIVVFGNSASQRGWNDSIYCIRMYNRSLTPEEVAYNHSIDVERFVIGNGGCTPLGELNVSTNNINFGEVVLNQSASATLNVEGVWLENNLNVEITGEDAAMFSFNQSTNWNGLTGGDIIVTFTPTSVQYDYHANLVVSSGTLTQTVALSGSIANVYDFNTYVDEDVYAMNTSIPIHGTVKDIHNVPVVNVEVEIGIFVMGMKRTLQATTNGNGEFFATFEPLPTEAGYYTVNSGHVGNNSTEMHAYFNIPGMSIITDGYILCAVTQNQPKTDTIQLRNKSSLPLNINEVSVLSAPEGCSISFLPLSLDSMEIGNLIYTVNGTILTQGNYYQEIKLRVNSDEGATTDFSIWYYCMEPRGILNVTPKNITTTMTKGKSKIIDVMVSNHGTAATGEITIGLPDVEWISVVGGNTLPSLAVNDSAYFSLRLSPGNDINLTQNTGTIIINCTHGEYADLQYDITAVSDSTGSLHVDVTDEYSYYSIRGPHLANAEVTLTGYYSLETVYHDFTNADGTIDVENLPEGYYRIHVRADNHDDYDGIIYIDAGMTNEQNVFVSYHAVTYSFNVVAGEIQDEYYFILNTTFETNVPAPVITIDAPESIPDFEGSSYNFNYTIINHGLIDAYNVVLHIPEDENFLFTANLENVDTLHAQDTIVIPCEVTRLTNNTSICKHWVKSWVNYHYTSGPNTIYKNAHDYTLIGTEQCGVTPLPPASGGGSGGSGAPCFGGRGGGGHAQPTNFVQNVPVNTPSGPVNVQVGVQFNQHLVMTREAFFGTFSVHNGFDNAPLSNIVLNFTVKDENGIDCTNLFQINTLSLHNIDSINGNGSLGAGMDGMAQIVFIPTKEAAPTEPKDYYFGGTFTFHDPFFASTLVCDLYPVKLTVHPCPDLYIDYFMQRDIIGDDALTLDEVEPSVPAELAVIINNKGAGIAKNVILETAAPMIVDNAQGLAIDFSIYSTSFNGNAEQLGLMGIPFGNIESGHTAVGEWLFTSSLLGHFVSYDAHVIHNNSFDNPELSLISHLDIHELIHPIRAYGSLEDGISDFLVNDVPDEHNYPDSIYFSNGGRTGVSVVNNISFDHYLQPDDTIVTLTVNPSRVGWNYGVVDDPGGDYVLVSCKRNTDNRIIPLNNIWQTFVTLLDGEDPIYENKLHIIDTVSSTQTVTYTLTYSINPPEPTHVPIGAIDGLFSVSDSQKVYFSQGNLQYQATTNTWRFADNQWDYVGDANSNIGPDNSGQIDLFGWGTSGYDHGATCYQPWSTNLSHSDYFAYGDWQYNLYDQSGKADWGYNAIANGGNQENQWRTLTHDEWNYIFNTRSTTSSIRYAKAIVNDVNGVILLPDNWNSNIYSLNNTNDNEANYNSNILTVSQWRILEQEGVVFLPAAGRRHGTVTVIDGAEYDGNYWSATHEDSWEWGVYQLNFNNGNLNAEGINARDNGISVRLVRTMQNNGSYTINTTCSPTEGGTVTGVGTYNAGETCTLTATANIGFFFTNWTENGSVVSTNTNYTFTVTGNRSLVANFAIGDHTYVDLGLPSGTLWATCNVGADTPEGYGDYFAWGEIQTKEYYSVGTYQHCNGIDQLIKYCNDSNYGYNGFTDNLIKLLPEDDAATANWGSNWRMPTKTEWQELLNNTTITWTTQNGVNGWLCTASNSNSIFLPAAGIRVGSSLFDGGCCYWSSSLYTNNPNNAWLSSSYDYMIDGNRTYGQSIRAVRSTNNAPTGAINGRFSVSDSRQVYFSQGNLQYKVSTDTWRFAEHQWDCLKLDNANISSTYDGWIDLFGWGTSGYNHGAICYQPWSSSTNGDDYYAYGSDTYNLYDQTGQADWGYNAISNGGNTENQWRTLTSDEWSYLLFNRDTPSKIRFAKAKVNDVEGLVVLPDNWDSSYYSLNETDDVSVSYSTNIITENDWTSVLEPYGVLFLPAGSVRRGTSVESYYNPFKGYYWASSCSSSWSAGYVEFNNTQLFVGNRTRNHGLSVRLVRTVHEGVTQTTSLNQGWNWFSTNVEITLDDLKASLVSALPNTNITIKSKNNGTTTYNGSIWRGQLTALDVTQMYRISVSTACEITLSGMPINPANYPITIHNGANWIAFPFSESMTVNNAFAGFAVSGDVIKSKENGIATYNGSQWRGTLNTLVPGQGYIYKSNVQNDRTFTFPMNAK